MDKKPSGPLNRDATALHVDKKTLQVIHINQTITLHTFLFKATGANFACFSHVDMMGITFAGMFTISIVGRTLHRCYSALENCGYI